MKRILFLCVCVTTFVMMPCLVGQAGTAGDAVPESYLLTTNRIGKLFLTETTGIQEIRAAFGAANVRTEQRIRQGHEETQVMVYIEGNGGVPSLEGVLTGQEKVLTGAMNVMDQRFVTDKGIRVGATFADLKKGYRIDDFSASAGAVNARSEDAQMTFVLSVGDPMNISDHAVVKKIRVWIF